MTPDSGKWETVHLITVTPFTDDGRSVDVAALEAHLHRAVEAGISVIVVGGNTSEYLSLSRSERRLAATVATRVVSGRARVIVGVGAESARADQEAREAERLGADGIMVHSPAQPFVTAAGWLAYHERIAAAIDVPIFPYLRNAAIQPSVVAELAERPYTAGIKYAVPDLIAFGMAADQTSATWICGLAETWAPAFWAMGASGFTSGLANVRPEFSLAMLAYLQRGARESVRRMWTAARPFESLRAAEGDGWNVSVVKEAMSLGTGNGANCVRLPSTPVPDNMRDDVRDALMRMDAAMESP